MVFSHTDTASVQRPHVEHVDALHLAENFQTLQTGSLLKVGRDGTGGTTRREKVVLILDLCCGHISALNVLKRCGLFPGMQWKLERTRQRSQELVLLAGLRVAFPWVVNCMRRLVSSYPSSIRYPGTRTTLETLQYAPSSSYVLSPDQILDQCHSHLLTLPAKPLLATVAGRKAAVAVRLVSAGAARRRNMISVS